MKNRRIVESAKSVISKEPASPSLSVGTCVSAQTAVLNTKKKSAPFVRKLPGGRLSFPASSKEDEGLIK